MRISDWSSDGCSSGLRAFERDLRRLDLGRERADSRTRRLQALPGLRSEVHHAPARLLHQGALLTRQLLRLPHPGRDAAALIERHRDLAGDARLIDTTVADL